jgi:hypothetical protein
MSRIIDAGDTFRLNASMNALRALLPRDGAEEMAEEAFRYAKHNWEKTNNRILPHRAWRGLRAASTAALVVMTKQHLSGRRNPDPEAWVGSEKQINWAKSIRAEATPVIEQWIKDYQEADRKDHQARLEGKWRHRPSLYHYRAGIAQLRRSLTITDAKFWIDNRTCPYAASLIAAVEASGGPR